MGNLQGYVCVCVCSETGALAGYTDAQTGALAGLPSRAPDRRSCGLWLCPAVSPALDRATGDSQPATLRAPHCMYMYGHQI